MKPVEFKVVGARFTEGSGMVSTDDARFDFCKTSSNKRRPTRLYLNAEPGNNWDQSSWDVREVVVWDRVLSDDEYDTLPSAAQRPAPPPSAQESLPTRSR